MKHERTLLSAIILLFILLGVYYSVTVPIFEAPDEVHHFFYAKHLADTHSLPVQNPKAPSFWAQEGSQPPLYYALVALVISPINTDRAVDYLWENPHRNVGVPFQPGNKNYFIHTDREDWPYRGLPLAVHIARWLSLLLGVGTILGTYAIVGSLRPDLPYLRLATAATVAFIPQFIFISAAVTNDNMINFIATLAILQMVRLVLQNGKYRQVLLLGLLVGLAALSKLSGLGLFLLGLVALSLHGRHRENSKRLWVMILLFTLVVLLTAGWWYARNFVLYGDATGLNRMLQYVGYRHPPLTVADIPTEFRGLRWSFWGLFGWFNIPMGLRAYRLLDALTLFATLGLILGLVRHTLNLGDSRVWALLLLPAWLTLLMAALVRWTSLTPGTQGRLLFPAISAIGLLFVLGWTRWLPRSWRPFWSALLPLLLLGLTAIAPSRWIAPAYAKPPRIHADQIPASAKPVDLVFGNRIRVWAVNIKQITTHPGDTIDLTLYMGKVGDLPVDYTLYVHLLGRKREDVGQINTFPGWGTYPTRLWKDGEIIVDHYRVKVSPRAHTPTLMRVEIGFFNYWTKRHLNAKTLEGTPTISLLGSLRLVDRQAPVYTPKVSLNATFGNEMALVGMDPPPLHVKPGETLTFSLYWKALRPTSASYTIFTHFIRTGDPRPLAQNDKLPLEGDYPTLAWAPGEVVKDTYRITVPKNAQPGTYNLVAGVYQLQTLQRLPLLRGPANPWVDNGVTLMTLQVGP